MKTTADEFGNLGLREVSFANLSLRYEYERLMRASQNGICLMTRDDFQNIVLNITRYNSFDLRHAQRTIRNLLQYEIYVYGCWNVKTDPIFLTVKASDLLETRDNTWIKGSVFHRPKPK